MKKLFAIILLTLVSCAPQKCPEGQYYECGKGCVDIPKKTVVVKESVPQSSEELKVTEVETPSLPIPKNTKYRVSDIVCVWEKDTGVVIGIFWGKIPDGHEPVLVYTVQFYASDRANEDFYETELQRGKCLN